MHNTIVKIALIIASIALIGADIWLTQEYLFKAHMAQTIKDDLVLAMMAQVVLMASVWETTLKR